MINETLEMMVNEIKSENELVKFFCIECDIEFVEKEMLAELLEEMVAEPRSNYNLEAFGVAGDGDLYVLLDGEKVGIITSEGGVGIIANNVKEFFSIMITCRFLFDYAEFNLLKFRDVFMEYYNNNPVKTCAELNDFVIKFDLIKDPDIIF